jgi:hypothetical protein
MAVELQERFYETQRAQLLRWVPWLHLFRAFRIALDPRKIVLGALAAFVLTAGDRVIDTLPFAPANAAGFHPPPGMGWPWEALAPHDTTWMDSPWLRVIAPLQTVVEPGARLFVIGNSWADVAYAWTQLLFHLAVWSLLGGAIARIAAVQFAKRETITARNAVGYSSSRLVSYCGAPLLPLVFIGFFWLLCLLVGLIGRIPGVGTTIAGVLWFIPLLIGIALAVILLVIAASWPLMIATISAEGTDAFDGLSRGYDYILNRPWYALSLVVLTVIVGTIGIAFVSLVCQAGVHLAYWSAAWGMGEANLAELTPLRFPAQPADPALITANTPESLAGTAATFWLRVLSWFVRGFVISYFWTAVTIIYFLLRLSLDAKPLDHVYVPVVEAGDALPLVGIPAAEQREAASADQGTAKPPDAPPG